jgi:hypothetical protein
MQRKIRRFVPSLRPSSEERTGERSWDVCLAQGWPSIVIAPSENFEQHSRPRHGPGRRRHSSFLLPVQPVPNASSHAIAYAAGALTREPVVVFRLSTCLAAVHNLCLIGCKAGASAAPSAARSTRKGVAGIAVTPPPTPKQPATSASGRRILLHRVVGVNLDALGHQGSKAMRFVVIEVQVPGDALLAVDADGEPAGASGENRLALCQGCSGAVNTIPWTDERVSLDALADECRELLGFGLGEVKVIGDPSLRAGDADSRTGQFLPPKVGTASTSAATELLFVSFAIPAVAQPHAARPIAETSNPDLPSARVIMVLSSIQGCPVIRPVESET